MRKNNQKKDFNLIRAVKKLFLSAFVVGTFILYALHQNSSNNQGKLGSAISQTSGQISDTLTPSIPDANAATNTAVPQQEAAPQSTDSPPTDVPPTDVPPTAVASVPNTTKETGQYKDGTYTGPEVDAQFGLVQVQALIQNGKIVNVQVLEYPNDRRTSVRINSIALPDLQQEVIQAQSANVDLIGGATLTSEAFQMSLQSALSKAKGNL